MDYNNSIDYINSFVNFENIAKYDYLFSFRLERMYEFLDRLENPHRGVSAIQVAGSKGKGSTCAIIAEILRKANYKVGLYTSPHLLDLRERIRVLESHRLIGSESQGDKALRGFEGCISENEFVDLVERIKPVAEKFREHDKLGRLSFFEVLTACAFLYFKEKAVDFVVLETGLGGRLDATNIVNSLVCGISHISMEHTDKLGNSLEAIAREKAGIIKIQDSRSKIQDWVIISPQKQEVRDIIGKVCNEKRRKLYEVGRDIRYSIIDWDENRQFFDIDGPGYSYKDLEINLIGRHQVENAVLGISMVESINNSIDEDAIRKGLRGIYWPGRLQVFQKHPYLILDGAHNRESIRLLISSLRDIFDYNKLICLFGVSDDKDIEGISGELDEISDRIVLTKSRSKRAADPFRLKEAFSGDEIIVTDNVEDALDIGMEIADKDDLVLITGSLYIVGEAICRLSSEYTRV